VREKLPPHQEMDKIMDPIEPNTPKIPSKFTGERIALLLGGTLIGALAIGFGFKMATPVVKKVCQSILETPDKIAREARVASVEAIVVKPGTISRRITTVGKLRANEFVTLRAEMQGRIKEIAFKEGSIVKKGDILIRFDDEELQAELARTEADVEYRQVRFGRFESLQNKGLGRGTEYDQERGQLNMAKAAVEVARAKLAKATIYAPFEGKIGLIDVSVGAIVDGQKELVTLVDFDPMKIDFKIPEKFIHDIGVGQTAEVKLDSIPDHLFRQPLRLLTHALTPKRTVSPFVPQFPMRMENYKPVCSAVLVLLLASRMMRYWFLNLLWAVKATLSLFGLSSMGKQAASVFSPVPKKMDKQRLRQDFALVKLL